MAFPATPLATLVELNLGGTWTDVTSDVYLRDGIEIERGRDDWASGVDPTKCKLTFNNRGGKFSPRNPVGSLYGQIGRNTPLRVSVNEGDSYLNLTGATGDFASTPDTAVLDITGDIDVRVDLTLSNLLSATDALQTVEFLAKLGSAGSKSWMFAVRDGVLYLEWSADGTATLSVSSTVVPTMRPDKRIALRATLDVNNGAGGRTAVFYTAPTLAGPWTQLGDAVTTAGTTSIFNSTTALKVGDATTFLFTNPIGKIHGAEIRNGIGGTVVANPDFTVQTAGATSFADGTGKTWTVTGAATISNRKTRFTGEVSSWPARWDVSGKDVYVKVEASGIMRRLGQGASPLQSTLRRRVPNYPNISPVPLQVMAYWPCEEDRDATRAYSPLPNVQPLKVTGFTFAADDTLPGSSALPSISGGATLSGTVPAPTGAITQWQAEFLCFIEAGPVTARTIMQWLGTGTVKRWRLMVDSGGAMLRGYDVDDVEIATELAAITVIFGGWTRWQVYAFQSGANVEFAITWFPLGNETGFTGGGSYAGSVGRISGLVGPDVYSADLEGMRLGHFGVSSVAGAPVYTFADLGFHDDTAGERLTRLAAEEDIPLTVSGDTSTMEQMGAQRPDAVLDLLQEAADVDGGILFESREDTSLCYRGRQGLYNQPVALSLDYSADGEVAPPLEPVDDDQAVRNDVTVTRTGGSSARATLATGALSVLSPPNGVGRYDLAVTLNLHDDDQPERHAGWLRWLGTQDAFRVPVVHVDLAAAPHLIEDVTALDLGDRMAIINPPAWLPPDAIDLHAQGYTESIGLYDWDLFFNCTPAAPWDVAHIGDETFAQIDTSGSTLNSSATSTATSVSVATASGAVWATSGATPFNIRVAGEVMTVTAISGASSPQAFTVVRSVNGVVKAQSSGDDVRLAHPSIIAL